MIWLFILFAHADFDSLVSGLETGQDSIHIMKNDKYIFMMGTFTHDYRFNVFWFHYSK